jgi:hypothetical protein
MLFSTVITPEVPAGTVEWIERERYLVNVAVSRARLALVAFGDAAHLVSLGARTLAALHDHTRSRSRREAPLSEAEAALLTALPSYVDVRLSATVANHPAPLSILTPAGTTRVAAVDHGQADATARLRELTIDQHMTAAGADVLRIPAWLCRSEPARAAEAVLAE